MASNMNANNLGTHFDKELLACLQHAAELKAKNRAGERNLAELELARNDITRLLGLIQMQQRVENRGITTLRSCSIDLFLFLAILQNHQTQAMASKV
jgi:hypothetical protein